MARSYAMKDLWLESVARSVGSFMVYTKAINSKIRAMEYTGDEKKKARSGVEVDNVFVSLLIWLGRTEREEGAIVSTAPKPIIGWGGYGLILGISCLLKY